MATVKLNAYIRNEITKELMNRRFSQEEKELVEVENKLAFDLYEKNYPKHLLDKMGELPEGAFPRAQYMQVKFEGCEYTHLKLKEPLHFLNKHVNSTFLVSKEDKFGKRYREIKDWRERIKVGKREAKSSIGSILSSVTTLKKLMEVWPEVTPIAKQYEESPTTLPSIPLEKVNTLLRLGQGKSK